MPMTFWSSDATAAPGTALIVRTALATCLAVRLGCDQHHSALDSNGIHNIHLNCASASPEVISRTVLRALLSTNTCHQGKLLPRTHPFHYLSLPRLCC